MPVADAIKWPTPQYRISHYDYEAPGVRPDQHWHLRSETRLTRVTRSANTHTHTKVINIERMINTIVQNIHQSVCEFCSHQFCSPEKQGHIHYKAMVYVCQWAMT